MKFDKHIQHFNRLYIILPKLKFTTHLSDKAKQDWIIADECLTLNLK